MSGPPAHNWDFGGHSAISTAAVKEKQPKSDDDLVTGLANAGTHEVAHDKLGHQGADSDIMNGDGETDPKWLFDPSLQFTATEAKTLQDRYNSSGEQEITLPPPTPAPPRPPVCTTEKQTQCASY